MSRTFISSAPRKSFKCKNFIEYREITEYAIETAPNCVLVQKFGRLIKWKYCRTLKDADDKDESNGENFAKVRQLCGKFKR